MVGGSCPLHHCATAEVEKSTMATWCAAKTDSARKRHAQTDTQVVKVIELVVREWFNVVSRQKLNKQTSK